MGERNRRFACSWGFLALLSHGTPSTAATLPLQVVEREHVVLRVRPLTASLPGGQQARELQFEVAPGRDGQIVLEVQWPDSSSTSRIELRGAERSTLLGSERRVELEARVSLPGGATVQANRVLVFKEATTALFELLRDGDRPLVLAVEAELVRESALEPRTSVGMQVQLVLQIERVIAGKPVPVETNRLNTFVGEPVSYSFRHGEAGAMESMQIRLTPLAIHGDLARIEIELSGTLPAGDTPLWVSRKEQWLSSRGATSSVAVETGQPPSGYRFLVTPRF